MRFYFAGSISGGRGDAALYRAIVDGLKALGHEPVTEHVADLSLAPGEALPPREIFERDIRWIEEVASAGGVLIAEVSTPSTGVGYEIAAARYRFGMPVVCLYRRGTAARCSSMVAGDDGILLIEYDESAPLELFEAIAAKLRALE